MFEPDYRVVTFDYVGSGRSDRSAYDPVRYGTLEGYASDLCDVLAALQLEQCVFVGASISGMIGMLAAGREPARVAALVMVGTSPRYIDAPDYRGGFSASDIAGSLELMHDNFIGWASDMATTAIKEPDIARELEQGICALWPHHARQFVEVAFNIDLRASLPRCTQPVLVVQSTHDDIVSDEAAVYLAQHLPRGTLRYLSGAGHCPQLTRPNELGRLIGDYLASMPEHVK